MHHGQVLHYLLNFLLFKNFLELKDTRRSLNVSARAVTAAPKGVPNTRALPSAASTTASASAKRRPPIVHSPQKNGGTLRNGQQTLRASGRKSTAPSASINSFGQRIGVGTAEINYLEQVNFLSN